MKETAQRPAERRAGVPADRPEDVGPLRRARVPGGDVALYVLSGLHLLTLVQFCAHFGWVIGFNVLFFLPAILMSALRRSRGLLLLNLAMLVIGVIFVILHFNAAFY